MKNNRTIFTKVHGSASITEERGRPEYVEEISTYEIREKNNKYNIYELYRKEKEQKILTCSKSKYKTKSDLLKDIESNKIILNKKYTDNITTNLKIIQTNYLSKEKVSPQMIAVVLIKDNKTGNAGHYVGISFRNKGRFPNSQEIERMKDECILMANVKYMYDYGLFDENVDSDKQKYLKNLKSEIVDYKFLYIYNEKYTQ